MKEPVTGYLMTCDRCRKTRFVDEKQIISWNIVFSNDLCPECNEKFIDLVEAFLKEEIESKI